MLWVIILLDVAHIIPIIWKPIWKFYTKDVLFEEYVFLLSSLIFFDVNEHQRQFL